MEYPIGYRAKKLLNSDGIKIINHPNAHPSNLLNRFFTKKNKITVVTPAFNSEKFIRKTIDSVLNQSIGIHNLQYIIVDDRSTDGTREIVMEYAKKYKQICLVMMPENTGSPGTPRNIGIELANSKYITFLDSDDWLEKDGLFHLYNILEETGDDYVVGRTIKVESESNRILGEYASVMERRSISPYDVPHFFYHMGPTARMMKLSLLDEHNIRFPEMTFAEDKLFFYNVFFHTTKVSTTTKPIYYVNRMQENNSSLTRITDVLKKREADLKVIHFIKSQNLPVHQEKIALNRIYEYDLFKTLDSQLFVKSDRKEDFFQVLSQAIETTKDLRYDFKEEFKVPLYRAAVDLFLENRLDDITKLFKWYKTDKNKKYVIKDNLPYFELPFFKDRFRFIRIPMLARALDSYVIGDTYYQTVQVFGDHIDKINDIVIRDRKRHDNELKISFKQEGNIITFKVDMKDLSQLKNSLFTLFIRYNNYQLINIKRILKNQIKYKDKKVEFYTTVANNLGLSVSTISN